METEITDRELSLLGDFVARTTGLDFPRQRWPDLRRGIAALAAELGIEDCVECVHRLVNEPQTREQLGTLASHLTVGETYFFRERRSFEILRERVLPALMDSQRGRDRQLKIWSAACCTGEEPYSIAISLVEAIGDWRQWDITLLATDINPRFLSKAQAGIFGPWSFRNAPAGLKERYFRPTADGRFEIRQEIKNLVQFAPLNLVEDVYPSPSNNTHGVDVIFCRNVLMYFTLPQAKKVMRNLHRAQSENGWLVVSPSELSQVPPSLYQPVNLDGVIVYQKGSRQKALERPLPVQMHMTPIVREEAVKAAPIRKVAAPVDPQTQAAALYREGRYAEAANILGDILPARPGDPAILRLLAHCLANQGRLNMALTCCDQWIAADKLNPSSHFLRSVILQEQQATDGAIQALVKAVYLDPGFALAHFALANIAHGRGREQEANRHLVNAMHSLERLGPADVVPESDGITAGRLAQIIGDMKTPGMAA